MKIESRGWEERRREERRGGEKREERRERGERKGTWCPILFLTAELLKSSTLKSPDHTFVMLTCQRIFGVCFRHVFSKETRYLHLARSVATGA